jgi:hypothetical protein
VLNVPCGVNQTGGVDMPFFVMFRAIADGMMMVYTVGGLVYMVYKKISDWYTQKAKPTMEDWVAVPIV